jgi:hypothetical protein
LFIRQVKTPTRFKTPRRQSGPHSERTEICMTCSVPDYGPSAKGAKQARWNMIRATTYKGQTCRKENNRNSSQLPLTSQPYNIRSTCRSSEVAPASVGKPPQKNHQPMCQQLNCEYRSIVNTHTRRPESDAWRFGYAIRN